MTTIRVVTMVLICILAVPFISPEVYLENLNAYPPYGNYLANAMIDVLGFDMLIQSDVECE